MEPSLDIRDIKGIDPLPPELLWLWIFLGLVLVAVVAWRFWRRRRKNEPAKIVPSPPSPYEVAVKALQQIIQDGLIDRGEVNVFYTRLSDVVRLYLEGRFHLHAPERTTEEFLYEVSQDQYLSVDHKELLQAFLQESDLVKFAKFTPGITEMKNAMSAAERFVHDTHSQISTAVPTNNQSSDGSSGSSSTSNPVVIHS